LGQKKSNKFFCPPLPSVLSFLALFVSQSNISSGHNAQISQQG
jgi:hypothetical protein